MKTTLPNHVKYEGPFQCGRKNRRTSVNGPSNPNLTEAQRAWMLENKPLYYTGVAVNDLPHIPQHLRFA